MRYRIVPLKTYLGENRWKSESRNDPIRYRWTFEEPDSLLHKPGCRSYLRYWFTWRQMRAYLRRNIYLLEIIK